MARTRFFQHLNENESDFQKVTTLEYIDNSDGFSMYYFKDGSKCNKTYIAPVNANSIEGFEFAEVTSPGNVWKLKKVIPVQEKRQTAVNADGVLVEAPTWEEFTNSKAERKTRVDVLGKPLKVDNYEIPNDSDYSVQAYMDALKTKPKTAPVPAQSFDFNNDTQKSAKKVETQKPELVNKLAEVSVVGDTMYIYMDPFIKNVKNVEFIFENTNRCEMTADEFIDNALTPKEEKVVEKVVEKEDVVKTSDTDIDLGIDNVQKGLLDNMIDMSNKMECAIDMELTLKLPPSSVYKLIKSVYPEGMDKGFVNILANRMQVKELKESVAEGLLAFYDDEYNEDSNKNNGNDSNITDTVKKPGRKKQTV